MTLGQAFEVAYQVALQAQKARRHSSYSGANLEIIETKSSRPVSSRNSMRRSMVSNRYTYQNKKADNTCTPHRCVLIVTNTEIKMHKGIKGIFGFQRSTIPFLIKKQTNTQTFGVSEFQVRKLGEKLGEVFLTLWQLSIKKNCSETNWLLQK